MAAGIISAGLVPEGMTLIFGNAAFRESPHVSSTSFIRSQAGHAGGSARSAADKHWWAQAEAVVGFLNAYQETQDPDFRGAAVAAWDFTKRHILDHRGGEWFWRVTRAGDPYEDEDKVGIWKCPYHNARACLEVMERTEHIAAVRS